jgi:hypothetical protein
MDAFALVMLVLGLALTLAVLALIAVVAYGRIVGRKQRDLLESLRRNGIAFACRPALGMQVLGGFVLGIDPGIDPGMVTLWRIGLGQPVRVQSFPRRGAGVSPVPVKINVARTVAGLSVVSAAGERIEVVIYSDPTTGYSAPAKGVFLDLVFEKIRESLAGAAT